jgi:hypothetical protein
MARWSRPDDVKAEDLFKVSEKVAKLTRLFAEENLQVSFESEAETACFYPSSRVLVFPYNLIMLSDDDIMMLFLIHEVGHAFWSSNEYFEKANSLGIADIYNIIEDIRIERKQKDKYPGMVGTFSRGYKKLYEQGFFGAQSLHPMVSFSNRLNIYSKCGPLVAKNIKFSEKEQDFYNRCLKADTEEEVLELAKELSGIDFLVDLNSIEIDDSTLTRITSKFTFGEGKGSDEDEEEDSLYDSIDASIEDEVNSPAGSDDYTGELTDEEREARMKQLAEVLEKYDSQFLLENRIKKANANGVSFTIYESMPESDYYTYSDFIKLFHDRFQNFDSYGYRKRVVEFLNSISRSVAYMAQEFEMKKAAARYKNAKVSTSGKIDINRVFKYKIDDEIFANRMIFKDDKRHGMVILLDGSGSIARMYSNMIRQVILLTEYAKKINVPFKVFMFGSEMQGHRWSSNSYEYDYEQHKFSNSIIYNTIRTDVKTNYFYEVLSSEMSREDYYKAAEILMFGKTSFGGTPTGEAMLRIESIAAKFFNAHNITNRKLFVVTDGSPTDTNAYLGNYVVVDPVTEKHYRTNAAATYTPISMIGAIFKDRYDIDMVSMVLSSSRRELSDFIPSDSDDFEKAVTDKSYNKNKFVKVKDTMGLPIFSIRPTQAETEIEIKVDSNTSVAAAANQLTKAMSKMQVSQVLLQALSEQFAV